MISSKHNFLYIHTPKTGGNSIQKALIGYSDDEIALLGPHHDGVDRFEISSPNLRIHKHSTLNDYQSQLSSFEFKSLFKACGVRNPWDRCVSHFFSPHRGAVQWTPEDFISFVKATVLPLQNYCGAFSNIDHFIRFEYLQEDFHIFCELAGLGKLDLAHLNKSTHQSYRAYYKNEESIRLIGELFKEEIEYFNYRF